MTEILKLYSEQKSGFVSNKQKEKRPFYLYRSIQHRTGGNLLHRYWIHTMKNSLYKTEGHDFRKQIQGGSKVENTIRVGDVAT